MTVAKTSQPLLIFEKSRPGRKAYNLPILDVPATSVEHLIPPRLLRARLAELPEVGELDWVRHFMKLSQKNFSIDSNFYPLGSCTMKYNPKIHEKVAALPGFSGIHPRQPVETVQGTLQIMLELERALAEISGMDAVSLQPAAGAHGEMTGLLLIRAYHDERRQPLRREVLIPDSAHGTNPASCTLCGYTAITVKSGSQGTVDLDDLKRKLSDRTAAMMITNPSTLGLFESNISKIAELVHEAGGQLYMDGANMNAILGITRPGDFGIDVMHFNLHKTFSTPHGGGGPGSGPIACKNHLEPYLPIPRLVHQDQGYDFDYNRPKSIGMVKAFYGNVGMHVRAYAYIRFHGAKGLRKVAEHAVINANYLMARLRPFFKVVHDRPCMHEFVLDNPQKKYAASTIGFAKRLIDYGFHPPTIWFPLVVAGCLMIEPTETESRDTLDAFAEALIAIAREASENPDFVDHAPYTTPVKRLDEVRAAKNPIVRWRPVEQ